MLFVVLSGNPKMGYQALSPRLSDRCFVTLAVFIIYYKK